jgi:hypothetical protein
MQCYENRYLRTGGIQGDAYSVGLQTVYEVIRFATARDHSPREAKSLLLLLVTVHNCTLVHHHRATKVTNKDRMLLVLEVHRVMRLRIRLRTDHCRHRRH